MYATHHHDLIYITVKYNQNIPKGIQVTELTTKMFTDGHTDDGQTQAHRYIPRTFRSGGKTYVVTPDQNHLDEMVLMVGHKICFYADYPYIIPVTLSYLVH